MSWSLEELLHHKCRQSLLRPSGQSPIVAKAPRVNLQKFNFTVAGDPMGKPRMTRRDVWAKRPVVLRYRAYCDRIRAAARARPGFPEAERVLSVLIIAYLPIPDSWSATKKIVYENKLMRQTPDWDNIGKAVCDALFENDSRIAGGTCWKFWAQPEKTRTEITVLFW